MFEWWDSLTVWTWDIRSFCQSIVRVIFSAHAGLIMDVRRLLY